MDIDLTWILLGLPLAFALGWLASRLDFRQLRIENRQAPKAYFRGLNFLLNEQQDQAIDAFIEAVQSDPDTSELHFALGNLFRRRGEYERAVRVHEHLLSRGDLSPHERERAQHALALDFLKAGLLDRAEEALRKLDGTTLEPQARLALLSIYERSRDWVSASDTARRLWESGHGDFGGRQAHYLCEQARALPFAEARALLEQAIHLAPKLPRPRIELATRLLAEGLSSDAFESLHELALALPHAVPLAAPLVVKAAQQAKRVPETLAMLRQAYTQTGSLDVIDALVELDPIRESSRDWYLRHLEAQPSLSAATRWIEGERLEHEELHPLFQRALDQAVRPLRRYRCAACGFEAVQHFWQCPGCQAWDSFPPRRVEEL